MHHRLSFSLLALTIALGAAAHPLVSSTTPVESLPPQVTLDGGVFTGINNGTTSRFIGIPYAKPPTGDLRFRLPVANDPYNGTYNATTFGLACTQQSLNFTIPPNTDPLAIAVLESVFDSEHDKAIGEDCLTINVWQPAGMAKGTRLPVVVWIYPGGFETGYADSFDGAVIVERSIELGEPVIYVSMNYRVSAFGFLGGAEVKAAGVGNLGLQDQRQALRWVQKYIAAFNGDPSRVTIWGISAGSFSSGLHLVANGGDTEGLFHAAFMQSGSTLPYGDITNGQEDYDTFVKNSECQGSSDTLQCLREAPYDTLVQAMNASPSLVGYSSLHIVWAPRADGVFLKEDFQIAVQKGLVAKVPFVIGDSDDEGTLFSLSQANVTTDAAMRGYISWDFLPHATSSEMDKLLELYPSSPALGSPYGTGTQNQIYPQYKRLASLLGDIAFHGPRRQLLQNTWNKQNTWSYLSKTQKATPDLGSFHSHDLAEVYGPTVLTDILINFVNHHDPNGPTVLPWPKYDSSTKSLLTFLDGATPLKIEQDNFREPAIDYLVPLFIKYPL